MSDQIFVWKFSFHIKISLNERLSLFITFCSCTVCLNVPTIASLSGIKSVMVQRLHHASCNADGSSSIITTTIPPIPSFFIDIDKNVMPIHYWQSTASFMPLMILPSLNLTQMIMSMSAILLTNLPSPELLSLFLNVLSYELTNPTSYSHCNQPNGAHIAKSIICHYSGHATYT